MFHITIVKHQLHNLQSDLVSVTAPPCTARYYICMKLRFIFISFLVRLFQATAAVVVSDTKNEFINEMSEPNVAESYGYINLIKH